MALQIVAKRKYSLKGFAEGWDDCYVEVRVASETVRKEQETKLRPLEVEMREAVESEDDKRIAATSERMEAEAEKMTRAFALQLIEGGVVVSTKEDGSTELVNFGKEDVPAVIDALGFAWTNDIIEVATGTDRLKAKMTSAA